MKKIIMCIENKELQRVLKYLLWEIDEIKPYKDKIEDKGMMYVEFDHDIKYIPTWQILDKLIPDLPKMLLNTTKLYDWAYEYLRQFDSLYTTLIALYCLYAFDEYWCNEKYRWLKVENNKI